jgi:glycosyltransferase involved in cell wall biosynthesis
MRISIIGPGYMSIPPSGWGAVESLIWDYYNQLTNLGHIVDIVNTSDLNLIINQVNSFNPNFVHIQYDEYTKIANQINCKKIAATNHYGYLTQFESHPEYHHILYNFIHNNFYIFCLSQDIKNVYLKLGVSEERLRITPNGANKNIFKYFEQPLYPNKSIYLAKIDYRKRQYLYQNIQSLYFAGNYHDERFDKNNKNYLGEWSKDFLYNNLTNYSNLVLLSDGEADPLVTKEALMAGLGLVISEYATANLDLSLPFIDIIPNDKLNDTNYIEKVIINNREKSNHYRPEIRKYAIENHSWDIVVKKYCNMIENIL